MKLALQLYSVRDALSPDRIDETLRSVREMGYDGAEWPGLIGYTPYEIKTHMELSDLELFSIHISLHDIEAPDTAMLDAFAGIGIRYLPIGWLPEECLADGARFAGICEKIKAFSHEAGKRGMRVLYHNHDFDLARFGDQTKLDALYEALPTEVLGAELDTCWLYSGGVDAVAYIEKYADRSPIIHLKDCVREGGRKGFMPVGAGVLDWDGILRASGGAEWLCVEQDEPSDGKTSAECAKESIQYLKNR